MSDIYTLEIDDRPLNPERPELGRRVAHDSRSKLYALPEPRGALTSVSHPRRIGILQQGNVGACTCFAGLGAIATGIFYIDALLAAMANANLKFDNASGIYLYKEVTKIDEFPGAYPPKDTGSSGNAVGKLFKQLKLINGWLHGLSLSAALNELQFRPVITGVNWYGGFDQPDSNGFIKISGKVVGGHEFVVDGLNVEEEYVTCTNSWGERYGLKGRFKMRFDVWERLLSERGDVTSFVPLYTPAPEPKPPTPPAPDTSADDRLAAAVAEWLKAKGYRV